MKVFVNRKPVVGPWGGGAHFINAFFALAPTMGVEIVDNVKSADIALLVGMDRGDTGVCIYDFVASGGPKIVVRVNENDARKGTRGVDDFIEMSIRRSHGTVFVSNWIKEYFRPRFVDSGKFESSSVVVNGVDRSVFFPQQPILLYDCLRMRIIAHHWSDNRRKGGDVYEFIDRYCNDHSEYEFHYIGRPCGVFKGKNTIVTPPCAGKDLGKALSWSKQSHNIYISASRFDPGPNHILEPLACGLETWVHADGGGAVEFAGSDHMFKTEDDLIAILQRKWSEDRPNTFVPPTWNECVQSYVEYMRTLL